MDITPLRFPHSDIFGSKLVRQLPEAFRNLLRPSSVSYVKAFLVCAYVTFYTHVTPHSGFLIARSGEINSPTPAALPRGKSRKSQVFIVH